jgi:hypothetical protein
MAGMPARRQQTETAMRRAISFALIAGALLVLGAATPWAQPGPPQTEQQGQRPRMQREPIYGSQLMTRQERRAHRQRMRQARTAEERERIRADHHAQMQERARQRGMTLPDPPPDRLRMGRGMGPGQGMGPGPGGGQR